MNTIAMWLGYCLMLIGGAFALMWIFWMATEFIIKHAGLTADVLEWARDRARKRRAAQSH